GGCEDAVNRDAAPVGVELRPASDTVNIRRDLRRSKCTKLVPVPRPDLGPIFRFECEGPCVQRGVRSGPGGQDGEVADQVLSRREPFRVGVRPSALKAACDAAHDTPHATLTSRIGLIALASRALPLITSATRAHAIGPCVSLQDHYTMVCSIEVMASAGDQS